MHFREDILKKVFIWALNVFAHITDNESSTDNNKHSNIFEKSKLTNSQESGPLLKKDNKFRLM